MEVRSRNLREKFRTYILPGVVFQAVIVGGGYATGREIVEYIAKFGASGLFSATAATLALALFLILGFEFVRTFKTYDYRNLMKNLLWKLYWAFDILYISMLIVIIAVLIAGASSLAEDIAGVPYSIALAIVTVAIGILCYFGRSWLEKYKIVGSILLYTLYTALFIVVGLAAKDRIANTFVLSTSSGIGEAVSSGFIYAMYNLVVFFGVLYALDAIKTRKEAIFAAIFAAVWGTIPLWITYIIYMGFYPAVLDAAVPWYPVILKAFPQILPFYIFVFAYIVVASNAGLLNAINDRINTQLSESGRELSKTYRGLISAGIFLFAAFLANFGIIDLIAKGYRAMAYGFIILFAIPLATIGVVRILKPDWKEDFWKRA